MISIALLGETDLAQELKSILHQYPDFQYLGQFHYGELQTKAIKPKLIILAMICHQDMIVEQIRILRTESKIFAFSRHCQADFVLEILRAGVHGYLWQDELFEDLPTTVRGLATGHCVFSESIAANLR